MRKLPAEIAAPVVACLAWPAAQARPGRGFFRPAGDATPNPAATYGPHTRDVLQASISPEDDQFLNELEHANFLFFWEQANAQTGLIKDRCNVRANDTSLSASIASTGFGLTAICIGEKRGFVSHATARLRVVQTLVLPVAQAPDAPRLLFPFRKYEYRRTDMGLGSFLGRYRHPALRRAHVPATFSR